MALQNNKIIKRSNKNDHFISESEEELSDEGEFFIRDRSQKPQIESFMSISQQHQSRAFGNLVVAASVKPSRVTAFEDASDSEEDITEGAKRMPLNPIAPIIKKPEEIIVNKVEESSKIENDNKKVPSG